MEIGEMVKVGDNFIISLEEENKDAIQFYIQ